MRLRGRLRHLLLRAARRAAVSRTQPPASHVRARGKGRRASGREAARDLAAGATHGRCDARSGACADPRRQGRPDGNELPRGRAPPRLRRAVRTYHRAVRA